MSDSNQFGSAGTAVAEPPAEEALAASKGPKPLVLVAVVVGVLVLAAAAYFLLFAGGGADDEATGAVPKASVAAPTGSTAPSASTKPVTSTAPQSLSSSGRDPFAALVVAAPAGSASAASTGTSGSGTTAATTLPSGLTETITLVKLNASAVTADVTVNGTKYTGVKRGQVFAKYFSLDIITGTTQAQFLFGDSSVVLTTGKSVTLRT